MGIESISIDFLTGHQALVWLALLVLLVLAARLYLRTNPPLPLWLRLILVTLRVIALLALIAALLEPVISYTRQHKRSRRIAVLQDQSLSMNRVEDGKSRSDRLDSLLSENLFANLKANTDISYYYFADHLSGSLDEVKPDKTALGEALRQLDRIELEEPADYWLLFSDGNSNSGRRPDEAASGLAVPIIAIDMAGNASDMDIGLADVEFNPVVSVGQPTEVKVKLKWHRAEGQTVALQLKEDQRLLSEKRYTISQTGGFGEITLRYTPDKPGRKLLEVALPTLENEQITGNNSKTISVLVLKSRLTVLLVSEHPDYEVGFLARHLRQSDRYDMELLLTGSKSGNLSGQLPTSQAELNRYDLIILHDPDPAGLTSRQELLSSYLREKGGSIWIIMGANYAAGVTPAWLADLLPFYPTGQSSPVYSQFQGLPNEENLFHPAVRLADERAAIRQQWASLPPFEVLIPCDKIGTGGNILAFASGPTLGSDRWPVLGFSRSGPGKMMVLAAGPLWRWGFVNLGLGADAGNYGRFVEGMISWLTVPDDFDPVRISPAKDVFTRGESVMFDGFAFDQGFRPITKIEGLVRLTHTATDDQYEADMIERSEGRYVAEFNQLPPGEYHYLGRLEKEGQLLKERQGRLLIETFSLEEFDQEGDPSTLMAISVATGGSYYKFNRFADAIAALETSPVTQIESAGLVLWGRLWLMLLFIGVLALEWFLRKANHLI